MLPALSGGLFIGVLSSLPYIKGGNVCCCLWVVSGGLLAAWMMQQNTPRPITVGEGGLVGLLSGLAGTLVWIVIAVFGLFVFSRTPFDLADFQRAMSEGGRDVPPEAREALENLSPAVILVVGGIIWAFVSMVFATIGGLLGALLFRRKGGPTAGLPTAPPPTFTPPTFTPPAPVMPPPFVPPPPSPPPPPTPPAGLAPVDADLTPAAGRAIDVPPPAGWPAPPEDIGDAATIMIPARSLNLPPSPKPSAPPAPPEPSSGAVPPADREPDSH
jgi:hypothetical protein